MELSVCHRHRLSDDMLVMWASFGADLSMTCFCKQAASVGLSNHATRLLAHDPNRAVRHIYLDWSPKSACRRSFWAPQPVAQHAIRSLLVSCKVACPLTWPLHLQALKSEGGFVWACKNYDGELQFASPTSFAPSEAKRLPGTAPFQQTRLVLGSLGAGLYLVLAFPAALYHVLGSLSAGPPTGGAPPCTRLAWPWELTTLRWLQVTCSQTLWHRDTARWG